MIVYPAIDLRRGRCVRLRMGLPSEEMVYSEDPVAVARRWEMEGARWLHIVNLDGAFEEDSPNLKVLAEILSAVEIPVQFGGGLRGIESIGEVLSLGVSRVVLGTVAVHRPEVVEEAITMFGPGKVAVGIDARDGLVATHGWRKTSPLTALELAARMKALGVVRIVHTDISRDGMLTGVNAKSSAELARKTGLKVIASGGVSSLDDIRQVKAFENDGLEGVIIGQALYTGAISLPEALSCQ